MQILQWLFKSAQSQERNNSAVNHNPTSEHTHDNNARGKEINIKKHDSAKKRTRRIGWRKFCCCKNLKLFAFLYRKEISEACFYNTLNLRRLGSVKKRRLVVYYCSKMKKEESISREVGIKNNGNKSDSSGAHVGNKVLPITHEAPQSLSSSSAKSNNNEKCDASKTNKGEKKKPISRMKELLRWAASAKTDKGGKLNGRKVSMFRRRGTLNEVCDDDEVCNESPKISFRWDVDSCSTISSTYSAISSIASSARNRQTQIAHSTLSIPPSETGSFTCREENWVTTDSESMRNPNLVLLAMQREKSVEAKNRRKDTPTVARDPPSTTATSSGSPASRSPPRKRTKGSSSLNQAPASPVVTRAEPLSTVFRTPDCFLPESVDIPSLLSSTLCPPPSEERLAQSSILDLRDQTLTFMMDLPGRFNFVVNQLFRLKDALTVSEGRVKELEVKLQKQSEGFASEEAKLKAELGVARESRDQLLKDVTKAEAEVEEAERKLKVVEEDLSSERRKSESLASKLDEVTTAWGASTTATVDAVLDQVRLIVGDSFDFSGVSAFKVVRDGVAVGIEDIEDDEDDGAGAEAGGHSTGEVADKTSNIDVDADVVPDEVNSPPAE